MNVDVIGIGQIKVIWNYSIGDNNTKITTCRIIKPNLSKCKCTDEILTEGRAFLHHKDKFEKNKGRKQSLKRALSNGVLKKEFITTKEQRKQI